MKYISKYLDSQRRLLEESVSQFLLESKHWPEDYMRTSFDKLKMRFPEVADEEIRQLIDEMKNAIESIPSAHTLNFIRHNPKWWFILDYIAKNAGLGLSSFEEVNKVIESSLSKIVKGLPLIAVCRDDECRPENVKLLTFDSFLQLIDKVSANAENVEAGENGSMYEVVPISSWEQMNNLYGGQTGFNGSGGWCHTEGEDIWRRWTKNGKCMFFAVQRRDWRDIRPPDPNAVKTAFDEYGMSLIAILVEVQTNRLLGQTLRWNHKVEPKNGKVDNAFDDSWQKLNKAVGLDVESICRRCIADADNVRKQQRMQADQIAAELLHGQTEVSKNSLPQPVKDGATHIDIPSSVTCIGGEAFASCYSLTSITIPSSVTSIGEDVFAQCYSLTSIIIPSSVTRIDDGAFVYCSSLTSADIPSSVRSIGGFAFAQCYNLMSIMLPASVEYIGMCAFSFCSSLTSISIPDSITYIDYHTFNYCNNLTSIIIPDSVTSIGKEAFYHCSTLTGIALPSSLTSIGEGTFANCHSLTNITIPSSAIRIGNGAFADCRGLTGIIFKGRTMDEVKDIIDCEHYQKNGIKIIAEIK